MTSNPTTGHTREQRDAPQLAETPRLALRPPQAAAALGISERALWTLTKDETSGIPHVRIGRAVVYPVADLERWLTERASDQRR